MGANVQHTAGTGGKRILGRILPGTDVMEGIEQICRENEVANGWVDCIGSLKTAKYFIIKTRPDTRVGFGYGDPIVLDYPVELIAAQGLIVNGAVHLHAIMCDDTGRTFGGHMIPGGNPVLITCEVSISEVPGTNCAREDDGVVDGLQFAPRGK